MYMLQTCQYALQSLLSVKQTAKDFTNIDVENVSRT